MGEKIGSRVKFQKEIENEPRNWYKNHWCTAPHECWSYWNAPNKSQQKTQKLGKTIYKYNFLLPRIRRSTIVPHGKWNNWVTIGSCAKSANVLNTIRDALKIPRRTGENKPNKIEPQPNKIKYISKENYK